jgi:hypothetical protein
MMHGVIERVIENWLTNSNERSYQIPFCQLLASEGETVLYVSPHGPFEQGKDIVTLDKHGKLRGYQLKCGDIGLAEWRKNKGEINDLVELPINHPAMTSQRSHIPFLVTNGEIKDTAIRAVNSSNEAWRKRKYPRLRTISKGELLTRFLAAHGSYLPQEIPDFKLFMELIVRDGHEPLDKERVSSLLESVLPFKSTRTLKSRECRRALSSALLLIGYILERPYSVENHWAVFEGWTIAASYVLALTTKTKLPESDWSGLFDLCEFGAVDALSALRAECETRDHLVEGDALTDGHFYGARMTLLVGLLSALALYEQVGRSGAVSSPFVRTFVTRNFGKMKIWGESAIPYFVMAALYMEAVGQQIPAESFLVGTLNAVLEANGRRDNDPGLPSPYFSPEQAVRLVMNLDERRREDFVGGSYTAQPLIDFLARRWRRQALRPAWYAITGTALRTFYPDDKWESFRWKSESGALNSRMAGSPQSWAALLQEVEAVDLTLLPALLRDRPAFGIFFILVYPHRFTREVLKLIESALAQTSG